MSQILWLLCIVASVHAFIHGDHCSQLSYSSLKALGYGQIPSYRSDMMLMKRSNDKNDVTSKKGKNQVLSPNIIRIDDASYGHEWQLDPVVSILENGGVAVIPTDTCYSFVTSITSKAGMNRLLELKGYHGQMKPLSLLCRDYSMISKYTSSITDVKWVYKLIKSLLPGPYTLILPSSGDLPKQIIEYKKTRKVWKRKEIGIRMPNDPICLYILKNLNEPLLCGSVPQAGEDIIGLLHDLTDFSFEESEQDDRDREIEMALIESQLYSVDYMEDVSQFDWVSKVDCIVDNGNRGNHDANSLSTVIDLTTGTPTILRQGLGAFDTSQYLL